MQDRERGFFEEMKSRDFAEVAASVD